MVNLLPCTCEMPARITERNGVCCTSTHTYCEAEGYTPEEWNKRSFEFYSQRPNDMRKAAKNLNAEAKRIEKMLAEFTNIQSN